MVGMTDASGHSEIFYFFHEYNPRPIETEWDLAEWTSQNCDTADKLAFAELSGESAKACSLFELQQWHCRWPIGDQSQKISVSAVTGRRWSARLPGAGAESSGRKTWARGIDQDRENLAAIAKALRSGGNPRCIRELNLRPLSDQSGGKGRSPR